MNINYLKERYESEEHYLHTCPEAERLRLFRQFCYEKKMLEVDPTAKVKNKNIFKKLERVFTDMGYRSKF